MMITFGDGRKPKLATVAAALLITRRFIQHAVKDSRAVRRKMKDQYTRARIVSSNQFSSDSKELVAGVGEHALDPDLCYRAITGYDSLSFDRKCGFDSSQLSLLFPEEMDEYRYWSKMHQSYLNSKQEELSKLSTEDAKLNEEDVNRNAEKKDGWSGGHLTGRLGESYVGPLFYSEVFKHVSPPL